MSDGISGPFIRHPIATTLLMVGDLVAGIIVYPKLPVAPPPQVDFPTIQVSASLPGASPETMSQTAPGVCPPRDRRGRHRLRQASTTHLPGPARPDRHRRARRGRR